MKTYAVTFMMGLTLVKGRDRTDAERKAERLFGTAHGPYRAKVATPEDDAYVRAMGGVIHE